MPGYAFTRQADTGVHAPPHLAANYQKAEVWKRAACLLASIWESSKCRPHGSSAVAVAQANAPGSSNTPLSSPPHPLPTPGFARGVGLSVTTGRQLRDWLVVILVGSGFQRRAPRAFRAFAFISAVLRAQLARVPARGGETEAPWKRSTMRQGYFAIGEDTHALCIFKSVRGHGRFGKESAADFQY